MDNFGLFNLSAVIFLVIAALTGCSLKDNLDDMHDNMGTMVESTHQVKGITESTFFALRPLQSSDKRTATFKCIKDEEIMGKKLACSLGYFYAFEFQGWKDEGPDDEAKLLNLKELAIKEFFETIQDFRTPNKHFWQDFEPLAPHTLDFYAVAANMHQIYYDQLIQASKKGFKPLSMLSMVEEALKEEHDNPARDVNSLPKWAYYIHVFKNIALDLIKARITFLPFLAYAEMTELDTHYTPTILWKSHQHAKKAWPMDLNQLTLADIDFYTLLLKRALHNRNFLQSLDQDFTPDNGFFASLQIRNIIGNMHAKVDGRSSDPGLVAKAAAMAKFHELFNLLIAPAEEFKKVDPSVYYISDTTIDSRGKL